MAFKLGSERREINSSDNTQISSPSFNSSNVPISTEPLEGSTLAEAKMDGSIVIDPKVNPKSALMRRIIKHEKQHVKDMKEGRAAYGDNWVMWEDKIYFRGEENGTKYVDGPNGRWPEGHPNHPWEAEAIAAEKINNNKG